MEVGAELRVALEDLRSKYRQMLEMRLHQEPDSFVARQAMIRLSTRFPGSLRELDELPLPVITRRIAALDEVLRGDAPVDSWMSAMTEFHALARGALCAKRWLAGRRTADDALESAYAAAVEEMEFPADARAWAGALAVVARPPRGRLSHAVFERLSRSLHVTDAEARALVFGSGLGVPDPDAV
jgi:hypothetical protein